MFEQQPIKIEKMIEEPKSVEIKPEKLKTEVPTLVAPGFSANYNLFKELGENMAQRERRVVVIDSLHGVETEEKAEGIAEVEMKKVEAAMKIMEERKIEKTDVIGHSEGGYYMVQAAKKHPEKFRTLILVDPAGIIGEDSKTRLGAGVAYDTAVQNVNSMKNPALIKPGLNIGKEVGKNIFSSVNDAKQAAKKYAALTRVNIEQDIKDLREKGVTLIIVHSASDKFFNMKNVQKTFTREKDEEGKPIGDSMLDGFVSVKGTHNQILLQQKEFAGALDALLDSAEKKQDKEKE